MRISTFRNRKAKDDHTDQVPVTEFIKNIEELNYLQRNVAWAPAIFDGWRGKDHWKSSQLLVLDIDDGDFDAFRKTLEHTKEECLITFTESHRKTKNGKIQKDCFRATFFLKEECFDKDIYKQTLIELQERYAEFGTEQNPDIAKYFWTSTGVSDYVQTYFPGKKIPLSKLKKNKEETKVTKTDITKLPIVSEYLLIKENDLENRRNDLINKVSYIMASHGYSTQEIKDVIFSKKLDRPLDDRYNKVIEDAADSGKILCQKRILENGNNFFKSMTIEAFFEEFGLMYDMKCEHNKMISLKGEMLADDIVLDYMNVEASKYQLKNRSRDILKSLISVWKLDKVKENITNMAEAIEFVEPSDEICKFVEAVTGSRHPLDIAVMKHWIWQIKRKFKKLETKHHLMPILYGKTRSGKTTAIERLLKPIKQLTMVAELAMVNDTRNDFNLIDKLVIFFDELGKAEKVVVSNLKQKITSSHITYRRLGTNQNTDGFNMCSFIGATNENVIDAIVDPTSARRFYEMKTLDQCNWKIINNIDYLKIWQSINEMDETAPIEEQLFALSEAQENIRAKDYVEEFVIEYGLQLTNAEEYKFVSIMDLYLKLKEWLETQNKDQYIPSINKFSRRLKNFCEKAPLKNINGVPVRGFFVNSNFNGKVVIESSNINLSKEN